MHCIHGALCIWEVATISHVEGSILEDYVANNLSLLFPGLELISRNERFANKWTFDIHAKDQGGLNYFIEVKNSECNRINIGQIVEYKANMAKVDSEAKVVLVCKDVDASIKEILKKIGVDIRTFSDLKMPKNLLDYATGKTELMKLSPIEQKAYFALLRRGSIIVRAEDLSSVIGVSPSWAKNILSKLARHGAAQRVGKGKYAIIPADVMYGRKSYVADPLVLVSELMKGTEYYVAYYSAAHFHGITEQMPFKTTVAVLKQMRPMGIGNISVSFVNLKKSRFFGYEEAHYLGVVLNVSDLEKTIVDCVDRQELSGGIPEVVRTLSNAFESGRVNWQRLVSYVRRFQSHVVAQRLGFIIEYLEERRKVRVEPKILDDLLQLTGSKIYPLDVKASKKGEISRKWKMINNAGYLEI
jgi:predicted transcriptional regulator of viral defense system